MPGPIAVPANATNAPTICPTFSQRRSRRSIDFPPQLVSSVACLRLDVYCHTLALRDQNIDLPQLQRSLQACIAITVLLMSRRHTSSRTTSMASSARSSRKRLLNARRGLRILQRAKRTLSHRARRMDCARYSLVGPLATRLFQFCQGQDAVSCAVPSMILAFSAWAASIASIATIA